MLFLINFVGEKYFSVKKIETEVSGQTLIRIRITKLRSDMGQFLISA